MTFADNRTGSGTVRRFPIVGAAMLAGLLFVFPGLASGGDLKHMVLEADLEQLDATALTSIDNSVKTFDRAKEELNEAKQAREKAKAEIDAAKQNLEAKKLAASAVKTEVGAAEMSEDKERISAARSTQKVAKKAVKAAEAQVDYAKLSYKASKIGLDKAESAYKLREAELELDRVLLLNKSGAQAAENYAVIDFRVQQQGLRDEYKKISKKSKKRDKKASKARMKWQKMID